MPSLPPVPGVAKITVVQSLAGVACYNVLHAYKGNATGWAQTELDSLASTVRTQWVTSVTPLQTSTLTLTDVRCDDLTSDVGYSSVATGSTAGTAVGSAAPANAAVCWSWKIPNRYRGGHPRTYIGGIVIGALSNANTITSTAKTAHTNAATAIRTAINGVAVAGTSVSMGAVSYYKDKALRPTPFFYTFSGVSIDDRVDSQRRRLGRDRV